MPSGRIRRSDADEAMSRGFVRMRRDRDGSRGGPIASGAPACGEEAEALRREGEADARQGPDVLW